MKRSRPTPKASSSAEAGADQPVPSDAEERGPFRLCLTTRERLPKEAMIRFVVAPDGVIVPDIALALPGRGFWVVADREAVDLAVKKGLFARAAGAAVTVGPDLSALIERLLVRRALDCLGLAKGAGLLILGSGGVQAAARAAEAIALIIASDGAEDGRRKSLGAARAGHHLVAEPTATEPKIVGCFSAEELSLALGRENVIHAALTKGGLTDRFLGEIRKLEGFRDIVPKGWSVARA